MDSATTTIVAFGGGVDIVTVLGYCLGVAVMCIGYYIGHRVA